MPGRWAGAALSFLGAVALTAGAGLGWLSWVEPHSQGIHPTDRAPVAALSAIGLCLVAAGVALFRRRRDDDR